MTTSAENEWPRQVAILGVGLLGGSVALALRRALPQTRLVGFARSPEKRQYLSEQGIIDLPVATLPEACQQSDVVVVAAPVDRDVRPLAPAADQHADPAAVGLLRHLGPPRDRA